MLFFLSFEKYMQRKKMLKIYTYTINIYFKKKIKYPIKNEITQIIVFNLFILINNL